MIAQLPTRTGSGVYFTNLIEGVAEKENGVETALIYGTQEPYEFDFGNAQVFPVEFKSKEVEFPIVGMSDEMPYDNTVYSEMTEEQIEVWMAAYRKRLKQAKEQFQPDIIVSHHLWYLTSLVLDEFPNTPVIGVSHGTDLRQARKNPHLHEAYVKDLNRLTLVFSLSHPDKEAIVDVFEINPDKIIVTGAGFNNKIFNDQNITRKPGEVHILYAGKLAHAKGIYELAKAFPYVKHCYPNVKLHMVGSATDEIKAELVQLAEYAEDFIIYDVKNQAALAECMKYCDIFVLPSYYEGIALIGIEALACRMRVVMTEIVGLMELLGKEVNESDVISYVKLPRLYDADKPVKEDIPEFIHGITEALKEQIQHVIDDREIPEHIYQKVNSHSWPQVIDNQWKLMQGVYAVSSSK